MRMAPAYLTAAALAVGVTCGTANAAEDDLRRQVRTMGRVLEEALEDTVDSFRTITPGVSVLGSDIDSEYIPTVGAIYFVRVGFPISGEVAPEVEDEPKAVEEEDLWERFSDRSWRRGGDRDGDDFWQAQEDKRNEYEDRMRRRMREHSTERFALMDDGDLMRMFYGGGGSAYDPERVEEFRRTLIGTVGKYGHRMTALPGNERVLVVVEAPAQRTYDFERDRRARRDAPPPPPAPGAPGGPRPPQTQGPRTDVPPPGAPPPPPRTEFDPEPPASEWRGRAPEALRFLRAAIPEWGPKERWLFSFEKSDLSGQKDFDALVGEIEEQRY